MHPEPLHSVVEGGGTAVSESDDYIKARENTEPAPRQAPDGSLGLSPEQALDAVIALEGLDWSQGLTRDQIRRKYRALPQAIYLRLPDSKRFLSARDVLREVGIAPSRAEGEFLGAHPDVPEEDAVEDGGPPAWGQQPGVYSEHAVLEGGSAEDREGLLPGYEPQEGEEPAN
jgi:hypothetical protein